MHLAAAMLCWYNARTLLVLLSASTQQLHAVGCSTFGVRCTRLQPTPDAPAHPARCMPIFVGLHDATRDEMIT
jgi:hypothetical protein